MKRGLIATAVLGIGIAGGMLMRHIFDRQTDESLSEMKAWIDNHEYIPPSGDLFEDMPTEWLEAIYTYDRGAARPVAGSVMEADIFLIPNMAHKIGRRHLSQTDWHDEIQLLHENGINVTHDERILEAWIGSNDRTGFKCTNMCDHVWEEEDGVYCTLNLCRKVPAALFKGKKEGDIVEILLPVEVGSRRNVELRKFRLTLAQSKHRYAIHGNFEDVFAMVTEHFYD